MAPLVEDLIEVIKLFDADRIERLIDHFSAALANGLAAPGTAADDIDIMPAAERHQVLHAWNPASTEAGTVATATARKEGA